MCVSILNIASRISLTWEYQEKKMIYFKHLEVKFKMEKIEKIFINYLLEFDDVVDFLSLDVPAGFVFVNKSARCFTVNA